MIYPFTADLLERTVKKREGESVKFVLLLRIGAVTAQLGRLLPPAASVRTLGQHSPSYGDSGSG